MAKLDATDLKILIELQKDATLSSAQVAERIGVSQSPTWRRMTQLEESGVIQRRTAVVDRNAVGLGFMVYLMVRLNDQSKGSVDAFRDHALAIPEVVQCHMLLGDIDFLLLVVTRDLQAYHALLRERISAIPHVTGIDSRVVIDESRTGATLPLEGLLDRDI
jgi:Lrp/AsnC family transcriptional regulator